MDYFLKAFSDAIFFSEQHPLIFTQLYFWGFFAVVLTLYSLVYQNTALRNGYLFFVSIFFYYKTAGLFVLFVLLTMVINYAVAIAIHESKEGRVRKLLLAASVVLNLFVLAYFKYAYFFTDSYNALFRTDIEVFNFLAHWTNSAFGSEFSITKILLPAGLSFYTFHKISYVVDVYRREIKPVTNFLDFGFYVLFFPHLVAGPIVRASRFIPQLYRAYDVSQAQFGIAVFWILNGLVKKMVIADYISVNFVDRIYANPTLYTGFENLAACFCYSLQVYCDFSGYTDVAIGVALLLGFELPQNFNSPYKAENVADFWRRWHMSLSNWLRDYLYIPLGGNRKSTLGTLIWLVVILVALIVFAGSYWWLATFVFGIVIGGLLWWARQNPDVEKDVATNINLMTTMLLGGLWHGASWNFVIWGGLNGLALVFYRYWRKLSPLGESASIPARASAMILTFSFITFTRIFFRSEDMETAGEVITQITTNLHPELAFTILWSYKTVFALFLFGMTVHLLPERIKVQYREWFIGTPVYAKLALTTVAVFVIYQMLSADLQPFIYFQF